MEAIASVNFIVLILESEVLSIDEVGWKWWTTKGGMIRWLYKKEIEHVGIAVGPPESGVGRGRGSVELKENILKNLWKFVVELIVITTDDSKSCGRGCPRFGDEKEGYCRVPEPCVGEDRH